jgi:hypothetical protein
MGSKELPVYADLMCMLSAAMQNRGEAWGKSGFGSEFGAVRFGA